jgi:rhodanese-related sulfurtransferase
LISWGFEAANMVGGMKSWAESGFPVVRDDGTPGTVI